MVLYGVDMLSSCYRVSEHAAQPQFKRRFARNTDTSGIRNWDTVAA